MKIQKINLFDMVNTISDVSDMISPLLRSHQNVVGYVSFLIAKEMGLSTKEQNDVLIAGLLHDVGATSLKERLDLLNFKIEHPHIHAEKGYFVLKRFKYFKNISNIVRFHHYKYNFGRGLEFEGKEIPIGSHILHLADRFEVLVNKNQEPLGQKEETLKRIKENSGEFFHPVIVEVFLEIADKEYFWFDTCSQDFDIDVAIANKLKFNLFEIDIDEFEQFSEVIAVLIDFRSRFTLFHSFGVSIVAKEIAKSVDFSEKECEMMKIAGLVHDIGKIAVPTEILEKPGRLEENEMNIIKRHPYNTYRIFEEINALDQINLWAASHHEKLDGTGYPFHLREENMSLGSRIMCISDIFTALAEDRPYRKGMDVKTVLKILNDMARDKKIDPYLLSILEKNIDEINSKRFYIQKEISKKYYNELMNLNLFRDS